MLKCNGCNIVISEILAFIQNQVDVMTEDSIIRLCVTAFSLEDIVAAKNLLYQSIKTLAKKTVRKGRAEGRVQRDLEDIISLIKCTEAEQMPIFVAKELRKLPPVTFDHIDVTRLLKDIIILKDQLEVVREQYATVEQLNQLRSELYVAKLASVNGGYGSTNFVNSKRGACNPHVYRSIEVNSGPFGMLNFTENAQQNNSQNELKRMETVGVSRSPPGTPSAGLPLLSPIARSINGSELIEKEVEVLITDVGSQRGAQQVSASSPTQQHLELSGSGNGEQRASGAHDPTNGDDGNAKDRDTYAKRAREGGEFKNEQDGTWIEIQKKKRRNQFVGVNGLGKDPLGKFKAADIKVPLFINNVGIQVSQSDIADYIFNKTQVTVNLVEIKMKKQRDYKAYKVFVPRHKLSTFLDENLWPEGITFRRFVDFGVNRLHNTEAKHIA